MVTTGGDRERVAVAPLSCADRFLLPPDDASTRAVPWARKLLDVTRVDSTGLDPFDSLMGAPPGDSLMAGGA